MAENEKQAFVAPSLTVEDLSRALYEANQKLSGLNRQLLESEKRRTELFANLSHDLRSPVATIKNHTEYLLAFPTLSPSEVTATLEQIQNKVAQLEYFIGQMLDITQLDATSEEQVHFEPMPVAPFLEDFFRACQADLRYASCTLSLNLPADFFCHVSADAKMLARVLENLFGNALKYTPPPCAITLGAQCEGRSVLISVSDNGIGIAPEHQTKIFERTYMVSGTRTPGAVPGCGLGLSIAQAIIHRHSGKIWCESTPGQGSIFRFTLPLAPASAAP